jgi:hypothetical protein
MAHVKQDPAFLKLSAQIGWKHLKDDVVVLMGPDNPFTRPVLLREPAS